jgi:seryl-tRNA synthetase
LLVRSIFSEPVSGKNLVKEIKQLNSVEYTTNERKARKARIKKKISNKLSAKEQADQQLFNKKKELEDLLKNKKNPPQNS